MVGEIYLAKIYFTDLSQYKIRPIIVVKTINDDCICLQLTTVFKNKEIVINTTDLKHGKLKKESLVVVPKSFTLHKSILFKYIGKIKDSKFKEIFNLFCQKMGCRLK